MYAYMKNRGTDVWGLREVEAPAVVGQDDVVVKVLATGVCGSDINRVRLNMSEHETIALGHEFSGVVVQSSTPDDIGRRVVVSPIVSCGHCQFCGAGDTQFCAAPILIGKNRSGSFGELVAVPKKALYDWPNELDQNLACLVDSVAVAQHLLRKTQKHETPENILIIGDGAIGATCALRLVKNYPHAPISVIGRHKENKKIIQRALGSHYKEYAQDNTYSCIVETVGRAQQDSLLTAIEKAKIGGTIFVLGVFDPGYELSFVPRQAFYKELKISGINSYVENNRVNDFADAIKAIQDDYRSYSSLITGQFAFQAFQQAIDECLSKSPNRPSIKNVVIYQKGELSNGNHYV